MITIKDGCIAHAELWTPPNAPIRLPGNWLLNNHFVGVVVSLTIEKSGRFTAGHLIDFVSGTWRLEGNILRLSADRWRPDWQSDAWVSVDHSAKFRAMLDDHADEILRAACEDGLRLSEIPLKKDDYMATSLRNASTEFEFVNVKVYSRTHHGFIGD